MEIKSPIREHPVVIITLTEGEAEQLSRVCALHTPIRDWVTATAGAPQGAAVAEFLNDLGNGLRVHGIA
jgi:hypothetical protein